LDALAWPSIKSAHVVCDDDEERKATGGIPSAQVLSPSSKPHVFKRSAKRPTKSSRSARIATPIGDDFVLLRHKEDIVKLASHHQQRGIEGANMNEAKKPAQLHAKTDGTTLTKAVVLD
jgi:hypothetical protein